MDHTVIARQLIETMNHVQETAARSQKCLRKAVGAAAVLIYPTGVFNVAFAQNGPSIPLAECSNVVGGCGCSHAEPRLVLALLRKSTVDLPAHGKFVAVVKYSPCTTCANILIDSRLFQGVVYDIVTEHDRRGLERLQQVMPVLSVAELAVGGRPDCIPYVPSTDGVFRPRLAHVANHGNVRFTIEGWTYDPPTIA